MTDTNTTIVEQAPSDAELDALFDEVSAKRAAGNQPASDQQLPEDDPDPQDKPGTAPTPVAAPAPSVATAPAPGSPQPAAAPAVVPPKDWSAMTPEEQRAAYVKLEQERQAAIGRAAAAQRAEDARRRAAAAPAAPAPVVIPEAERLAVAYPELKTAVTAEIEESLAARDARLQEEVTKVRLESMAAAFGDDWHETMSSDSFNYWLSQQPPQVQQKINGNSVAEYASLLRGYQAANPSSPTTETADQLEAKRITAEREKRLAGNARLPQGRSSVGGNTTGEPDAETDPDALFSHISRQRDARRERSSSRG